MHTAALITPKSDESCAGSRAYIIVQSATVAPPLCTHKLRNDRVLCSVKDFVYQTGTYSSTPYSAPSLKACASECRKFTLPAYRSSRKQAATPEYLCEGSTASEYGTVPVWEVTGIVEGVDVNRHIFVHLSAQRCPCKR
ncbi:hypothetical protein MRX96_013564 [Rhipicephalus microplus]